MFKKLKIWSIIHDNVSYYQQGIKELKNLRRRLMNARNDGEATVRQSLQRLHQIDGRARVLNILNNE